MPKIKIKILKKCVYMIPFLYGQAERAYGEEGNREKWLCIDLELEINQMTKNIYYFNLKDVLSH